MKRKLKNIAISIIIAILAISFNLLKTSSIAYATRALTMTPMRQRIVLNPGEKYEGSFTVSNPASSDENFNYEVKIGSYLMVEDGESKDDYGKAEISQEVISNYNIIMNWITIENPVGSLAPNVQNKIFFTIDVPIDAPAGGQYASLLVSETKSSEAEEDSLNIVEQMQMAMVIYAEVAGETIKNGGISENNIPTFLLNNKLNSTSMVYNAGNVHTDAEYILQVWPLFSDEEICTNDEEPETSLVLPETERYHTQSCSLPPVGIFKAKQTVKIFGEESIVEKVIIVCPLWLLFIIFFAIAVLIIWLIMRTKARKHTRAA